MSNTRVIELNEFETEVVVKRDEELDVFIPILGVSGEFKIRVVLSGKGASARVYGAGVLTGTQQLKLTVDTIHKAPDTTGSTLVKAVVMDSAKFDFFGMIKILKKAQKSIDFLQQNSLLLSENASANAVPGLEIEANDVKASHAATAAPVNQDQMFYLRSRGISEKIAERLVTEAFLAPAMRVIADALRARILQPLNNTMRP